MTTRNEIQAWFEAGIASNKTHMIIVCDTYNWEDYPVYVPDTVHTLRLPSESDHSDPERVTIEITTPREHPEAQPGNMRKVMECYDLRLDMESQLAERRANHWDVKLPGNHKAIKAARARLAERVPVIRQAHEVTRDAAITQEYHRVAEESGLSYDEVASLAKGL